MGISPSLLAGFDLLTDDGMSAESAGKMLVAAQQSGKDPEQFARHFLKLRQSIR